MEIWFIPWSLWQLCYQWNETAATPSPQGPRDPTLGLCRFVFERATGSLLSPVAHVESISGCFHHSSLSSNGFVVLQKKAKKTQHWCFPGRVFLSKKVIRKHWINKAVSMVFTIFYTVFYWFNLFNGDKKKTHSSYLCLFQMFCTREGGHLVSINSQADYTKVLCLLVKDLAYRNLYWIGARKRQVSSSG